MRLRYVEEGATGGEIPTMSLSLSTTRQPGSWAGGRLVDRLEGMPPVEGNHRRITATHLKSSHGGKRARAMPPGPAQMLVEA